MDPQMSAKTENESETEAEQNPGRQRSIVALRTFVPDPTYGKF